MVSAFFYGEIWIKAWCGNAWSARQVQQEMQPFPIGHVCGRWKLQMKWKLSCGDLHKTSQQRYLKRSNERRRIENLILHTQFAGSSDGGHSLLQQCKYAVVGLQGTVYVGAWTDVHMVATSLQNNLHRHMTDLETLLTENNVSQMAILKNRIFFVSWAWAWKVVHGVWCSCYMNRDRLYKNGETNPVVTPENWTAVVVLYRWTHVVVDCR